MIQLGTNWKQVVRKAWSVRFIIMAGLLSGVETILPFFSHAFQPGVFAGLSFVAVAAAFVARIVVQKDLS